MLNRIMIELNELNRLAQVYYKYKQWALLEKANNKEFILEKRERKIISTFIEKINKELTLEKDN